MRPRTPAAVRAWAGPVLIVAAVVVVLHDLALFERITIQHVDLLPQWLPNYCYLGETLASGNVPAWNPHVMTGLPFAADPQSGWMYAPAMVLHTALPCGRAFGLLLTLHPILAGLGAYGFLRAERASRAAATTGGLALAMAMAGSRVAITVPFAGSVAWTMVMLAAAGRWVRSERWAGRIGWAMAVAAAWGQVAGAHLSHGLQLATLTLAVYLLVRRRMLPGGRGTWAALGLLGAGMLLVNLAVLVPRFAYLPRTSLWLGYEGMDRMATALSGIPSAGPGMDAPGWWWWPMAFVVSPGPLMGLATLALGVWSLSSRPYRRLALGLGGLAAAVYLLSLRQVAGALGELPATDLYAHAPGRLRYGVLMLLPLLAGLGLETWRRRAGPRSLLWPGLAVLAAAPLVAGVAPSSVAVPLAGAGAAAAVLAWTIRRPVLLPAFPAVLAMELVVGGLLGQGHRTEDVRGLPSSPVHRAQLNPLLEPRLDPSPYISTTAFAEIIRGGEPARYLSWEPSLITDRGYLGTQAPRVWPLLANQRATLLRLEDAQGYNPVQPLQWWRFVRGSQPRRVQRYNAGVFWDPPPIALDRMQVGYTIGTQPLPVPGARPRDTEGPWTLWSIPAPPRATLHTAWHLSEDGVADLVAPGRDPAAVALDRDPGIPRTGAAEGGATFRWVGDDRAMVMVETSAPAILLIRNQYDPGWEARIEGREATVLRADGFLQAVAVGAGRHRVDLRFRDPWIGLGAMGSAVAVAAMSAWALVLRRRERR